MHISVSSNIWHNDFSLESIHMGSSYVIRNSVGRYMVPPGVINFILESSGSTLVALLLSHLVLILLVTLIF